MEMIKRKKGSVYMDIFVFLVLAIFFLLIAAYYDFMKVEIYEPTSDIIKNQTLNYKNNASAYYQAMLRTDEYIEETILPFNLFFIFISFMAFGMSIYKAAYSYKTDIFSFLGKNTAGLIAFIYFLAIYVLQVIVWILEEIWNPIFGDVINLYVPSFNYLLEYSYIFVIVWWAIATIVNQLLGKEEGELQ